MLSLCQVAHPGTQEVPLALEDNGTFARHQRRQVVERGRDARGTKARRT